MTRMDSAMSYIGGVLCCLILSYMLFQAVGLLMFGSEWWDIMDELADRYHRRRRQRRHMRRMRRRNR